MEPNKFDEFVSLGSNCVPGLVLRKLGIKGQTYPFDWVGGNAEIVLSILQDGPAKFLDFSGEGQSVPGYMWDLGSHQSGPLEKWRSDRQHVNAYGQRFVHDTGMTASELRDKLARRMERLFALLEGSKRVLFIYSSEESMYHEGAREQRRHQYGCLCAIADHIAARYPKLQFGVLNIDCGEVLPENSRIATVYISPSPSAAGGFLEFHQRRLEAKYRRKAIVATRTYLASSA